MKTAVKWFSLLTGICAIIAGLYLFFTPITSLASLSLVFSAIMCVNGIFEIVRYLSNRETAHGAMLVNGILTVVLAILLLSSSWFELVTFIPYLFAFWVLFSGVSRLFIGFSMRNVDKKEGNTLLLVGVLGLIVGCLMLSHPLLTGLMIAYFVGAGFIYQGVVNIAVFFKAKKQEG